jgi:hypothetical protein
MDVKKVIAGAVSGFVAAALVDLNAWSKSTSGGFDWALAIKRWVAGAVSGALAALGMAQV